MISVISNGMTIIPKNILNYIKYQNEKNSYNLDIDVLRDVFEIQYGYRPYEHITKVMIIQHLNEE